jgi:hypothetical protein
MTHRNRITLSALALAAAAACASRPSTDPRSATLDVFVSAGAPIQGATITVTALDESGQPIAGVGSSGVVGTAGATDASGHVAVLLAPGFSGLAQVVASVGGLQYANPTIVGVNVAIPSGFSLTSYVVVSGIGTVTPAPVTILTTLADHAALAWAQGRHPAQRTPVRLTEALAARDPLFVKHVTSSGAGWNPSSLRTSIPAPLTAGPTTLNNAVYAGLVDVGLNALAHDIATSAGYDLSSTTINAITLAQLLEQDLDADGTFDGLGAANTPIVTTGTTPVALTPQTLRLPLAWALDRFMGSAANKSGITRADMNAAGVYGVIAGDASSLFGASPAQAFAFDITPPVVSYDATYATYVDERAMSLATNAQGLAVMPPAYVLSAPKSPIPENSDIWKTSPRLAWASAPSVAQLEGANPDNTPALRWAVAYNPATDAPIASGQFSVTVSYAGGPSLPPATGTLWPAGTGTGVAYFVLPLSANLIPQLASIASAATLSVTLTVADLVGNTTTTPAKTWTFHTTAPALAVVEDTTYPAANDPRSTYPYTLSGNSYAKLFDATTPAFAAEQGVRLVRYLVSNPYSVPLAISEPDGQWHAEETWQDTIQSASSLGYIGVVDVPLTTQGPALYCPTGANCPCPGASCAIWTDSGYKDPKSNTACLYIHRPYADSTAWEHACQVDPSSVAAPPPVLVSPGAAASAFSYVGAAAASRASGTFDVEFMGTVVTGTISVPVVPAATTGPGVMVVYVARPANLGVAGRLRPLTATASPWTQPAGQQLSLMSANASGYTAAYRIDPIIGQLTAAYDVLDLSWQPLTWRVSADAASLVGEQWQTLQQLTVSRTIGH